MKLYTFLKNLNDMTISARTSYATATVDISREGFTPVGIVGFVISNANTFPLTIALDSSDITKVSVVIGNRLSSQQTVTVGLYVLYTGN